MISGRFNLSDAKYEKQPQLQDQRPSCLWLPWKLDRQWLEEMWYWVFDWNRPPRDETVQRMVSVRM